RPRRTDQGEHLPGADLQVHPRHSAQLELDLVPHAVPRLPTAAALAATTRAPTAATSAATIPVSAKVCSNEARSSRSRAKDATIGASGVETNTIGATETMLRAVTAAAVAATSAPA